MHTGLLQTINAIYWTRIKTEQDKPDFEKWLLDEIRTPQFDRKEFVLTDQPVSTYAMFAESANQPTLEYPKC